MNDLSTRRTDACLNCGSLTWNWRTTPDPGDEAKVECSECFMTTSTAPPTPLFCSLGFHKWGPLPRTEHGKLMFEAGFTQSCHRKGCRRIR